MRNPFRNRVLREQYDIAVRCYDERHKDLFWPDGRRHLGSNLAVYFWRGYDGLGADRWDANGKQAPIYAMWRAGRDIKDRETRS